MLVLSPECWCKDNQHTEYFQTTDEHHQRAEPFCHIRQFAPRHGWSDFRTQRRSHITHTTQGDGDGIGIVDAHGYHRERYHQTDDEISGEEGKQRNTLLHRYVHTINLQWQHGVRMQNLAEFILHHSYQHHATDTSLPLFWREDGGETLLYMVTRKQTHYKHFLNSSLFQPLSTSVKEHLGIAAYPPITP